MSSPHGQNNQFALHLTRLQQRVAELERQEKVLLDHNKYLRELYDRSPVGYQSLDQNGCFLEVNTAWLNCLGYHRDEVIGKNFGDFLHPEWRDHFKTNFPRFQAVGEILGVEFAMQKKDGGFIIVSFNGKIGRDADGHFQQTYCVFQDITRQKQAEEALVQSEKKWRNIIVSTPQLGISLNPAGRVVFANSHFLKLVGWDEAEVINQDWFELFVPAPNREERRKAFSSIMGRRDTADFANYENAIVTRKGELRNVAWSSVLSRDSQRTILEMTCLGIDLTERTQAETNLRESEERFRALHNASFGGIAIHDGGLILECNQGLADISGHSVAELIGMDGLLLIAPSARELVRHNIVTGYDKPYEAVGIRKNGTEYPLRLEGKNIPYKGRQVRTVEFRDITERKQAETERENLQAQLLQAQKMESVGRLAGGVAHDFNNMLGVILGRTEMAVEGLDPANPLHADLEEIRKAAERSVNLTRQLLAFARKQTIAPKVLDFNEAVASMLKMVQRLIGEDIDLSWLPKERLWSVKIDPSQLDQILANLCVNARDAIAGIGKVTIETDNTTFDEAYCATHLGYIPGDYVMLALSDSGCGMDKGTLSQLFEPFFTTKEIGKGTGLGLATVYGVVRQNGGFINVYSELGQGTTFRIYLPRHQAAVDQMPAHDPLQQAACGKETLLLVEDEPAILAMTTLMLERLGYHVLAAATPSAAIALAREHSGEINLMLTDVVMPEMNGRDLARHLLSLYPELKLLFMSGYTANVIAHHGVLDQGVEFIEKPFSKKDLATKIRKLLSMPPAA